MAADSLKLRRTEQHEVTPGCGHQHCYIHDVDEDDRGAYLACFECSHVYPTARALRQAYRRVMGELDQSMPRPWFSDEWRTGRLRCLWRRLTIRASRIYSCPECAHDF